MSRLTSPLLRLVGAASLLGAVACGETEDPPESPFPGLDGAVGDAGYVYDSSVPFDGSTADSGAPDAGGQVDATGIPCDVQKILRDRCTSCHAQAPLFGAPMSLASYAALQAPSPYDATKKAYQASQERINSTTPALHMPPSNQPQLDAAQLKTLNDWLAAGAPQSSETCGGTQQPTQDGGAPIDTEGLECYKLTAHEPGSKTAPYKVGSAKDVYSLFSFKAPWQGVAYGIVLRPIIDNAKVLHHWLLFQTVGAEDGKVIRDAVGAHPTGDLVHGWAPGGNALDFRDEGDLGFEFPTNTGFEVEMHYNSSDASAVDASGVEVCVQKKKPANLAGVSWLGSDTFNGTTAKSTCNPRGPFPINIMAVSPHMHLKGRHMKAVMVRANGTRETIHDAPFDFDNQTWYPAKWVMNRGDKIETECTFSSRSSFGKATTDEMCYLFTVAYPKGALSDGLPLGQFAHGGGACLGL